MTDRRMRSWPWGSWDSLPGLILNGLATLHCLRSAGQRCPSEADLQRLKSIVPPASHPMVEVGYHAANLWFAAQKKNWPLANYYWGETRNRLRW